MRFIILLLLLCGLAGAQIDWQYIDKSNAAALDAFLDWQMNSPEFTSKENRGCIDSWKGVYNCTGYGILSWVLKESRRTNNKRGLEFCALAARHLYTYGYDWKMHRPGGEGVRRHPVNESTNGQTNNWDSDWLRHCHLPQYVDIFKAKDVPLKDAERWQLLAVLADWMHNWYLKRNWHDGYYSNRERGDLFQYGRGMIPCRAMLSAYELLGDEKYLRAAETVFAATFFGLERKLDNGFVAYDTGYPSEKRTERLAYIAAHMNMEPWQMGYVGETAAYLYAYTKNPIIKKLIREVVIGVTDWVARDDIPMGDLHEDGDGKLMLCFIHGGVKVSTADDDEGEAAELTQMSPGEALAIAADQEFLPLMLIKAHYWDGGYYKAKLPDGEDRIHYPRYNGGKVVGPKMDHATIYNWANLMMCRYLLTGKKSDLQWAQWIYRDSKYFANRSSVSDVRTLEKRDKLHFGTGNIGKTRSFAWWAVGSLWAKDVLRKL